MLYYFAFGPCVAPAAVAVARLPARASPLPVPSNRPPSQPLPLLLRKAARSRYSSAEPQVSHLKTAQANWQTCWSVQSMLTLLSTVHCSIAL